MPSSSKHGKNLIKDWLDKQKDIKTIVDVGCGQATYPKLLGDKYKYIGIEIWAPYIKQWELEKYYKYIIIGDIRYVIAPPADCIIFGDILEHLNRADAIDVLYNANLNYPHVIVSIPLIESNYQIGKDHYGNWFERHQSEWEFEDLAKRINWDYQVNEKGMGIYCR